MITLIFDTETSGLPDFKAPHSDPGQPDIIQFGMIVYDGRYPVFELGCLINYKRGVVIEPDAHAIHGIDIQKCKTHGWSEDYFCNEVTSWFREADRIVGHNLSFDWKMLRTFYSRAGVDFVPQAEFICTMHSTTRVLCLPHKPNPDTGRIRGGSKWPSLKEAYAGLVDPAGFGNAHNALADVNACAAVLWKLEDTGVQLYNEKNQPV